MDELKEEKRVKRFSSGNWEIINSLKQQKKELAEFEDQYEKSNIEISSGQDIDKSFNDGSLGSLDDMMSRLSASAEQASSSGKYNFCVDANHHAKRPLSALTEDFTKKGKEMEIKATCPNGKPSKRNGNNTDNDLPLTESMQDIFRKYERFRNATKDCEDATRTVKTKKIYKTGKLADSNSNLQISSRITAAVNCLLTIEPMRKYFQGIALCSSCSTASPKKAQKSSLDSLVKVFKLQKQSNNDDYKSELRGLSRFYQSLESHESCFEALKGILAALHEEIIVAKKTGKVKRTCLRRCRQSTRANHSIISHIFRGHMRQRAECPCGHVNIEHEAFTSLPISFSTSDTKTIVLPVTSYSAGGSCLIQKYFICFNQWTTVANLISKIRKLNSKLSSRVVVASVEENDILHIHDGNSAVFEAMCKDGELQAFEEALTTHGEAKQNGKEADESDYPYTSTPAVTDMSDFEANQAKEETDLRKPTDNNGRSPRSECTVVPLVFKASHVADDSCYCQPAFVRLPKLINGGRFSRVCSQLLGLSECDFARIYVSIKHLQNNQCLLCSDVSCSGCHWKASRTVTLGPMCKIVTYIIPSMLRRPPEIIEHTTLTSGNPASIWSIEEGLACFRKQSSAAVCSVCGENEQVVTTRSVINHPDILVIKIDRSKMRNICLTYPRFGFAPALSKSVKQRRLYNLSGIVTSRRANFGSNNRELTKYSFLNSTEKSANLSGEKSEDSHDQIDMLVYCKAQTTVDQGKKKKVTATATRYLNTSKVTARKKRIQELSSSFQKLERRNVDAKVNDRTRQVKGAAGFPGNDCEVSRSEYVCTDVDCVIPIATIVSVKKVANMRKTVLMKNTVFDGISPKMRMIFVHLLINMKCKFNLADGGSERTPRDDDTASVCNCTRCRCLQKCAEQIRGSASTTIENIKLNDDQIRQLKESVSTPNASTTVQLHRAILKQDLRRAVSLLKRGSNPNELVDGIAAVHLAAGMQLPMGYFFTKLLIDHDADPNLKTSDGVTPVQLASMWNRAETLRFLSYHGGDLTSTNDIIEIPKRIKSRLSNVYSQPAATPKAFPAKQQVHSPLSSRETPENSPNYSEADLRLKSLIQLQRSLREHHRIMKDATGPVDEFEHLKLRSIASVKETITRGQQTDDDMTSRDDDSRMNLNLCDIRGMSGSGRRIGADVEYSDFSIGYSQDSVLQELDEADFPAQQQQHDDLNSSNAATKAPSSVAACNSGVINLSTLEEDTDNVIYYSLRSHMRSGGPRGGDGHRLLRFCCGGARSHGPPRQQHQPHRTTAMLSGIRSYFRGKLVSFREFVHAVRSNA
eukprot:gene19044-20957_t